MITTLKRTLKIGLALASVSLLCSTSQAALLSSTYESQLESWLGAGGQGFTNVYTYASGDEASDFHDAADHKGATFTLLKVLVGSVEYVIGGYNPQSWNATINSYTITPNAADRTAFLFNLTSNVKLTQDARSDSHQVFNASSYGPTFGRGHDLLTGFNPNFGISGYAYNASYGQGTNIFGNTGQTFFTISELEVYTLATTSGGGSPVPDASSTFSLFGLALLGLVGVRSRMKRV